MKERKGVSLTTLNGAMFFVAICNGYRVIKSNWDGWNWHFLLEQTDKTKLAEETDKWKFLYYAGIQSETDAHSTYVTLLCSWRGCTRNAAIKKYNKKYYEDRFHKFHKLTMAGKK